MRYWFLIIPFFLISCGTETTPTHKVNTEVTPQEGGEINVSPEGTIHDEGTGITLTPQPSEGYTFVEWKGDFNSTNNPLTFTLNQNVNITGVFENKTYALNIITEGEGTVTEEVIQQKSDYEHGTVVELTANSSEGWSFINWSDDISRTENPTQVTIESEFNITANFDSKIKKYGGSEGESGHSIEQTSDGGYVITGQTNSIDGDFSDRSYGNTDIFILKLNPNGEKDWLKTYGGTANDRSYSITESSDGGFVIAGHFDSNDGDFNGMHNDIEDMFVMKVNSNGIKEWVKTYSGSGRDIAHSVIKSSDGNYVITGGSFSNDGDFNGLNNGASDIIIIKLDENGNEIWMKAYGGSDSDYGHMATESTDGGFVITGETSSNDGIFSGLFKGGTDDGFLFKIDDNGNNIWTRTIGGSDWEKSLSVIRTSSGGYLTTGFFRSNDGDFNGMYKGGYDVFAMHFDSNGNKNWVNTVGGSGYEYVYSVSETATGKFLLTGRSDSNDGDFNGLNKGKVDILALSLDSNGNTMWLKTIGGGEIDVGQSVIRTSSGHYVITGGTYSNDGNFTGLSKGEKDIYVMKLDDEGNLMLFSQ